MSVQHAGLTIQEARLKAGLTQEQLSEGICSPVSLSRIESGSAGVSPVTFQALMSKAGAPCEAFPVFASRADFDCFYTLKRAKFYIDIWNLSKGYLELEKVETANFADNKFYYQEWLLLHSRLQFRSGCGNHQHIFETLSAAITISKPEIDFFDFRNLLFSTTEIELLIALAQEALYLSKLPMCLEICTQISSYLENSAFSFLERDNLLAANAIVYAKYLIAVKDYSMALEVADKYRKKIVYHNADMHLHELSFLTGLGYYHLKNNKKANIFFLATLYSAHSIKSIYATSIHNYLTTVLRITIPNNIELLPLNTYTEKIVPSVITLSNGIYDINSTNILTFGKLIKELRTEQKISQQTLCTGLCSKSMLSKIENDTIDPSIILSETLLQRLGICDRVFTFYGNESETHLHTLRAKLISTLFNDAAKNNIYLEEMESLIQENDFLYLQFVLYRKAQLINDTTEKKDLLLKALSLTHPNWSSSTCLLLRYSHCELKILCQLAELASKCNEPTYASTIFCHLQEILSNTYMDALEARRIAPLILCSSAGHMYRHHFYGGLSVLLSQRGLDTASSSIFHLAYFYSHYSQATIALNEQDNATNLLILYAYYNFMLSENTYALEKYTEIVLKKNNVLLL